MVGLLPLVVAFPIVCRFTMHDAMAVVLAPAEQRLAFRMVPSVGFDLAGETLVNVLCPAEFVLVIVSAVVRLVQHIAAVLVLDLAIVKAWSGGAGASPVRLRVAAAVGDR
ncbi:hypothetical protein D3227_35660 [Mesorhizobium waimense]|uniref:Uncharacterized protein n=1 Tax=Mesorhizobium waimense TaxID=1300307 RepID=A0A3A5K4U1_9HYPH|nr:hypothetical protein [Mesorhizobium waimense]RJT27772.1 hypothetical protein D3227_35660 [Mesorhizobium waimense]